MYGLSLSFCIADIIRGIVNEGDVIALVTNVRAETPFEMEEIINHYQEWYWYDDTITARHIVERLYNQGRIHMQRLCESADWATSRLSHSVACGHWVSLSVDELAAERYVQIPRPTQGGGTAIWDDDIFAWVFVIPPEGYISGDRVPEQWSIAP
jgi:hypothetical protein